MDYFYRPLLFIRKISRSSIKGNLTVLYIFALTLMASLALCLQIIIQNNLDKQKHGFEKILFGRKLSEPLAQLKNQLYFLSAQVESKELQRVLKSFYQRYDGFYSRAKKVWLEEGAQQNIIDYFGENKSSTAISVIKVLSELDRKVLLLKKNNLNRNDFSSLVFEIADLISTYQKLADQELSNYDKVLAKKLDRFRKLELIIFFITILVLLGEALFIFRPAINKLNHALTARSDFFSRMGHEIRNPMNSILGMVSLLEETKLNDAQKLYLSRLKSSSQGLLHFLNNMIDYSVIEQKKNKIHIEEVDLKVLVQEIVSLFSLDAYKKNLGFYFYLNPNLPLRIETDYIKLRQIIFNLVGNAIKFTPEGQISIELGMETKGKVNQFVFFIKDTGIGIPTEKQEIIFDSFVQGDSSIGRSYGGTGLGLSIVRDYLDMLDGEINLTSEVGRGSSFTVKIPVQTFSTDLLFKTSKDFFDHIVTVGGTEVKKWSRYYFGDSDCMHFGSLAGAMEYVNEMSGRIIIFDEISSTSQYYDLNLKTNPNMQICLFRFSAKEAAMVQKLNIKMIYPVIPWFYLDQGHDHWWSQNNNKIDLPPESFVNLKVLVCDDSLDNRYVLSTYLKKFIRRVDMAADGLTCIELYQKNDYDLIFLDIQMPLLDGFSTMDELKKIREVKNIQTPVVAFTAHNTPIELKKMQDHGFHSVLSKPVTMDLILTIFSKLQLQTEGNEKNHKETLIRPQSLAQLEKKIKDKLAQKRPEFIRQKYFELKELKNTDPASNLGQYKIFGHQLKGSGANFGHEDLSFLGKKLEEAANTKDLFMVEKNLGEIEVVLDSEFSKLN